MGLVELLQRVGLNKYEAEAYAALLAEGPLTGYELGKRSGVPLSRSYEVLDRLARQGLALVQPGDPPRYRGQDPAAFLDRLRREQASTLEALAEALADLSRPDPQAEFWVVRGRQPILAHLGTLVGAARQTVRIDAGAETEPGLSDALAAAQRRGCGVEHVAATAGDVAERIVLALVDERQALAGTLDPADRCQAVVSANPALGFAVRRALSRQPVVPQPVAVPSPAAVAGREAGHDWIAWEERKQRRLRSLTNAGPEVA